MKTPEWLKSNARKACEAAERKALLEQKKAERKQQEEAYARERALANTPEKLEESGTAMLINLIKNYEGIYVFSKETRANDEIKWLMGNIVFDAIDFNVSYREGLSETFLFSVPFLQQATVRNVIRERLKKIEANPMPLEKMKPVEAELRKIYADIEQRKKGLADKEAIEELDCEYGRRRRDLFVRLAQETLENNK